MSGLFCNLLRNHTEPLLDDDSDSNNSCDMDSDCEDDASETPAPSILQCPPSSPPPAALQHQQQQHQEQQQQSRVLRVAVGSTNPCKIRAVTGALEHALRRTNTSMISDSDSCPPFVVLLDVQGFNVESNVPNQPFGDEETKAGAHTRSKHAYLAYRKANDGQKPHLSIGMEGGLEWYNMYPTPRNGSLLTVTEKMNNGSSNHLHHSDILTTSKDLYCMAWMAIYGRRTGFVVDALAAPGTTTYKGDTMAIFGYAKTGSFVLPMAISKLILADQGMELGDVDDQVFRRIKSKHGSGTVGILTNDLIDRSAYYEHALKLAFIPWIRPDMYPNGN